MVSYRSHVNNPKASERILPLLSRSHINTSLLSAVIVGGEGTRLCAPAEQKSASTSEVKRCWNLLNKYRTIGLNKHS